MFVLIIFLSSITGILSCQPRTFSDYPKYIDPDPHGWYSFYNASDMPCNVRYNALASSRNANSGDPGHCSNSFIPSIEIMQFGLTKLIHNTPPNTPVFLLGCDSNGTTVVSGRVYTTPKNVHLQDINYISYTDFVYDHRESAKDWISLQSMSMDENAADRMNFFNFFLTKPNQKIDVLKIEYKMYTATISSIAPSKGIMYSYRALLKNIFDNVTSYLNFVLLYGVYVRSSSTFGGSLEIFLNEGFILNVKKSNRGNKFINYDLVNNISPFLMIGGEKSNDVSSWVDSVKKNPKPLKTDYIMIYDFIEPNTESERKASLKLMVNFLQNRATLQILKQVLEKEAYDHKISHFLITAINSELNFICPSNDFVRSVQNGKLLESNPNFKRYFLFCMHDVSYWEERGDYYVKSEFISLIDGLCFSRGEKIGKCIRSIATFPPEINCMQFFHSDNCLGIPFAKVSKQNANDELNDIIRDCQSFSYC